MEVGKFPAIVDHLSGAGRALSEGRYLPHALDAVHHMGVNFAQLAAQFLAQSLGSLLGHERADGDRHQERRQHQRDGPGNEGQSDQHASRHQDRDECRSDGVGEEELNQLNVAADDAHQVSRAPAHHVGRGQRVQLVIDIHPHLGQKAVGKVVGHPRLRPGEEGRQRHEHAEQPQQHVEVASGDNLPDQ